MSRFLHHCREQRATELPLEKKIKTPGYAMVRHLSTCIMYCSAHAGSNAGGSGGWLPAERAKGEGGGGCQGRWEEEEKEAFLLLLRLLTLLH